MCLANKYLNVFYICLFEFESHSVLPLFILKVRYICLLLDKYLFPETEIVIITWCCTCLIVQAPLGTWSGGGFNVFPNTRGGKSDR